MLIRGLDMVIKIEDIELRKLVLSALKDASSTISKDLKDALDNSDTIEELINNWQSALENLKGEVEHYWGALEEMKHNQNLKA